MASTKLLAGSFFVRAFCWLKGQIVGDVPAEDAICEFDCRKLQCSHGEWSSCSRRLKYLGKS